MCKKLKNLILVLTQLLLSLSVYSQKDVTQFLNIPIDGYKSEMIKKLKDKGYKISSSKNDILIGEFNGVSVNIHIATNNNKVWRLMITDVNTMNEQDIKIRFNNLCQQLQSNKKYISALVSDSSYMIQSNENISYQILVNKKRYEAVYYQRPTNLSDNEVLSKEIKEKLLKKYTQEQLSNPTEEIVKSTIEEGFSYMLEKYSKKSVWFMINEHFGKYYITMFYDNEYNRANGEDL